MIPSLAAHRGGVLAALRAIDSSNGARLERVGPWGADLRQRILGFVGGGKLIRGSLVAAGAEAFGGRADGDAYLVGACLELVQSFLLIHDDIMDEDAVRRGVPAMHEQYRALGAERGYTRPERFGESMGICAGDVAVLLAMAALHASSLDPEVLAPVCGELASEIAAVGVAQMADVANGHASERAGEGDILAVYRYKTGRYTFSLPLMLGSLIAGAAEQDRELLARWGELQGIIFQIRDDYLGVMVDSGRTGKPAGSDICSDKQTLQRLLLFERAAGTAHEAALRFFGRGSLSPPELELVRRALRETGTIAELEARVQGMGAEAAGILVRVGGLTPSGRRVMQEIAAYNAAREV